MASLDPEEVVSRFDPTLRQAIGQLEEIRAQLPEGQAQQAMDDLTALWRQHYEPLPEMMRAFCANLQQEHEETLRTVADARARIESLKLHMAQQAKALATKPALERIGPTLCPQFLLLYGGLPRMKSSAEPSANLADWALEASQCEGPVRGESGERGRPVPPVAPVAPVAPAAPVEEFSRDPVEGANSWSEWLGISQSLSRSIEPGQGESGRPSRGDNAAGKPDIWKDYLG